MIGGYSRNDIEQRHDRTLDKRPEIKLAFTIVERTEIRDALLKYLSERGIGVPTLYDEICRHDPLKRTMSMRTLQRYLARAHETQDHNVSICYEFVKDLPSYSQDQRTAQLGNALTEFMSRASGTNSGWLRWQRMTLDVRHSDQMRPIKGLRLHKKLSCFEELMAYSTLVMERDPDRAYFRTIEVIENPFPAARSPQSFRFQTEGVAVPVDDLYLLWIGTENLTRRPRTALWMRKSARNTMDACVVSIAPQKPEADNEIWPLEPVDLLATLVGDDNETKDLNSGEGTL